MTFPTGKKRHSTGTADTPDPRPVSPEEVYAAGRLIHRLADLYVLDAVTVARICDEELDRSGALLGHVRLNVCERGLTGGYPHAR